MVGNNLMKDTANESESDTVFMMSITRFDNDMGYSLVQGDKSAANDLQYNSDYNDEQQV
jgi:hypothetical protein